MKTLVIATMLLVLAVPAFAKDQPTKKDVYDVFELYSDCYKGGSETLTEEEHDKACKDNDLINKKMNALGYCVMGHVFIARKGRRWTQKENFEAWQRGERHCYNLNEKRDARVLQYFRDYEREAPWRRTWKERCKKHPEFTGVCGGV